MNNPLKNNLLLKTTKSMATKCIVLGQPEHGQPEQEKKGKPIEFVRRLIDSIDESRVEDTDDTPDNYENIELVSKSNSRHNYDLIFAYNDNRSLGIIFLGHWNDGFVE